MIVCFICKWLSDTEIEKWMNQPTKLSTFKKFDFGINIAASSELIKTRPLIKSLESISDSMNLFKSKIYYLMSEYVT